MELKCDVCGGGLQMNAGGHSATCVVCGMGYTVERLREKLNGQNAHDDRTARIVPPIYIPQVDSDEDKTEVETEVKIPVNYMFFLNKKPVLAVFLLESNERSVLTEINRAARSFAFNGISCIHFYTNFRNDMPYIVQRISGALGRGHHN